MDERCLPGPDRNLPDDAKGITCRRKDLHRCGTIEPESPWLTTPALRTVFGRNKIHLAIAVNSGKNALGQPADYRQAAPPAKKSRAQARQPLEYERACRHRWAKLDDKAN